MCLFLLLPAKQLPQHHTFNHSEIFMLPGNNWTHFHKDFICWQLCIHFYEQKSVYVCVVGSMWTVSGKDCCPKGLCHLLLDGLAKKKSLADALNILGKIYPTACFLPELLIHYFCRFLICICIFSCFVFFSFLSSSKSSYFPIAKRQEMRYDFKKDVY